MLPYPNGAPPPLEPAPAYPPAHYPPPSNAVYPTSSPPAYNPSTASYSPTASPYPSPALHQPPSTAYSAPPTSSSSSPTSLSGVDLSTLPLMTGTVRWFNPTKGYGFIAPSDGSPNDAFVHQNQLQSDGFRALEREQIVEFRMRIDPNTGKHIALAVTAPGGGKLPAGRREEDRDSRERDRGDKDRDRDRDRDRGPPPFRAPPPDNYPPPAAASHPSADLDARAPPYDGRNARPPTVPFCVGVVKSFDVGKGFGFLTQLTTASGQPGAGDIFVHQTNVHMEGRRELVEGMMLEYMEGVDDKNGKPLAKNVTGRGGSLITRHDVEASIQHRRPHPSPLPPHSQPQPSSPHSRSTSTAKDNSRNSHVGSRDIEINSQIQPSSSAWHRGTVLTFDPVKKYGFIKPDDGGENMFLHATRCEVPMEDLVKGLTLEYQVGLDTKGKECGVNIRRVRGAGGYGPVGRQRSPHRAPPPYARDGRGQSPGRARYDEYDGRRDSNGYDRDRGEYRRGYDRRTPPRDYPPPPPAAYPPPPATAYAPPPPAQQPPPPLAAYYDPYRSDPRYGMPPAAPAPGSYPPQQAASAPPPYDPHYPPPPASYYQPPTANQPPAGAPTAYYGQHTAHAQPPAPSSTTQQYYYPPAPATAATTAAQQPPPPPQYAYPPPPAPSVPQPAASTAAANGTSSQPNQMLAHLYSLYSTLSANTATAATPQQSNTAAPTANQAAPAAYHYTTQPTATYRQY